MLSINMFHTPLRIFRAVLHSSVSASRLQDLLDPIIINKLDMSSPQCNPTYT